MTISRANRHQGTHGFGLDLKFFFSSYFLWLTLDSARYFVDGDFRFSDILALGVVILRFKLYLDPLCEVRDQFARSFGTHLQVVVCKPHIDSVVPAPADSMLLLM